MRGMWLACGLAGLAVAGCARGMAPPAAACRAILADRVPAARVTASSDDRPLDVVLDYELRSWWEWSPAATGRIACSFEPGSHGGLRLRAATLDGDAFPEAAITVINADLLFAEMRASARSTGGE